MTTTSERLDVTSLLDPEVFRRVHEEAHKSSAIKRVALVASKGTLDMAYPPLILATTAAAMGMEVGIFFTFYGLDIINKKKLKSLKVSPIGNPAAPIPVPNIMGVLPGATQAATMVMQHMMGAQRMPTVPQFLDMSKQLGVKLIGCTTTMGVMGVTKEDLIDGVDLGGAATFLEYASKAQVTLFI